MLNFGWSQSSMLGLRLGDLPVPKLMLTKIVVLGNFCKQKTIETAKKFETVE